MYEVEVRPGPGSGFFQYYTETVEAPTSHDAESRVQRANPGCIVRTTKSWTEYDDDGDSGSHSSPSIDGAGLLVIAALFFIVAAWKYILLFGGIAFVIWFIIKIANES
jgi:hypothetical protein